MTTTYTVVPRTLARQYDGANSIEILEPVTPSLNPAVISEDGGTLVVRPGPPPTGTVTATIGQFVIYEYTDNQCIPVAAVHDLNGFTILAP